MREVLVMDDDLLRHRRGLCAEAKMALATAAIQLGTWGNHPISSSQGQLKAKSPVVALGAAEPNDGIPKP